jgi:ABC-2 type transport system ATP-binding protein
MSEHSPVNADGQGKAATVVTVDGLTKEYGDVVAVDDISFEIGADEIFAFVGPNGAGKTTVVEMLECLRTPTSGSATVLGHDITSEARAIKKRIGVVPQSFHTFERLTVHENVTLIRRMYDDSLETETVLDHLDLEQWADTPFHSLSGGLQRRTGMAMALVSDPDVLFLDEPTTGLDPDARRTTWAQIERLADLGTTVVLTTHYMEEVEALADRTALLVDGAIEAVDTVSNLVDQYGGEIKLVVSAEDVARGSDTASAEVKSVLRAEATDVYRNETNDLVGIFDDRTHAQDVFSQLHELEGERSIDLISAGMEDVFLRLAGGTPDAGGELA